jgi:predicted molibdopterin-dependent oxidoreductase YjgC
MFVPGRSGVEDALGKLELLIVIDGLLTETAKRAHVVFADAPAYSKDGTCTSADRRVQRLRAAQAIPGDARPAWETLAELGRRLAQRLASDAAFPYAGVADVTAEIAERVGGYGSRAGQRAVIDALPGAVGLQPIARAAGRAANGEVVLLTGRTLYTSLEGASIGSPEADKLHREDGVLVNQYDASELGIVMGEEVVVRNGTAELALPATLTTGVPRGSVFVSSYLGGGAINALLPPENGAVAMPRVTLAKRQQPSAKDS